MRCARLSFHVSICPSVRLSLCLSVSLSLCLYVRSYALIFGHQIVWPVIARSACVCYIYRGGGTFLCTKIQTLCLMRSDNTYFNDIDLYTKSKTLCVTFLYTKSRTLCVKFTIFLSSYTKYNTLYVTILYTKIKTLCVTFMNFCFCIQKAIHFSLRFYIEKSRQLQTARQFALLFYIEKARQFALR